MSQERESIGDTGHVPGGFDAGLTGKPEYPGQTLGIVALVLSFFSQVPALILAIIAWVWSHRAGMNNVPAKVAVAISSVLIVLGTLAFIGWIVLIAAAAGGAGVFDIWEELAPGGLLS
jgi:hypothetical protein